MSLNEKSLKLLSFVACVDNGVPVTHTNSVPWAVKQYLWNDWFSSHPPSDVALRQFFNETKNLKIVLETLFKWQQFENNLFKSYDDVLDRFYYLINSNLTDVSREETLEFALVYTYLSNVEQLFLPEQYTVFWYKDKYRMCKWCSDDVVYATSEEKFYFTNCCWKRRLSYYNCYDVDNIHDIVTDMSSYCVECHRALFNIIDTENDNFPRHMYFCNC